MFFRKKSRFNKNGPCSVFIGNDKKCDYCGWNITNHTESMRKAINNVIKNRKK